MKIKFHFLGLLTVILFFIQSLFPAKGDHESDHNKNANAKRQKVLQVERIDEARVPLIETNTKNTEAYNHYLQGRDLWNQRRGLEDLMAAMKHFNEAIALDPNYALTYSGLADVYSFLPLKVPGIKKDDVKAQAEEAAKKAIALDPDLAEAHASFGLYKVSFLNDYKGAEREYKRAIELNPNYAPAHQFYSAMLWRLERFEEALAEKRWAYELEPSSIHYSGNLGNMLRVTRQYDAAINHLQRSLELDPNNAYSWSVLGSVYIHIKKFEDATRAFVGWAELTGFDEEMAKLFISHVAEHDRTGEPVSPSPELEKYYAKLGISRYIYIWFGHKEKSLVVLEQAFENESHWIPSSPEYDFLRSEPRFIALEQKRKQKLGLRGL